MSTRDRKKVAYGETLQVRDACLCLHVHRAARALGRRFDEALRPLEITHGQFSLLNALNRPDPARMTAVAELLGLDRTTLTAALKPLERSRLVRVTVDVNDKRIRLLALTPAGEDLLARAVPIWRHTHDDLEAALPTGDPTRLRTALDRLGGQ